MRRAGRGRRAAAVADPLGRPRHGQDDAGPPARPAGRDAVRRRSRPSSPASRSCATAIAEAREARRRGRRTVLFIDEIHRFNKAQQDALLPAVEDGTVTLIGATTENPSFEVNGALLSRGPRPDAPAPHRGGRRDHPPPGPGRPGARAWPRSGRRSPRRTWSASPRASGGRRPRGADRPGVRGPGDRARTRRRRGGSTGRRWSRRSAGPATPTTRAGEEHYNLVSGAHQDPAQLRRRTPASTGSPG